MKKLKRSDFFKSFLGERVLKIDVIEIEKKSSINIVMTYLSFFHRNTKWPFFMQQEFYKNNRECDKRLYKVVDILMKEKIIEEIRKGILWRTTNEKLYEAALEAKKKSSS